MQASCFRKEKELLAQIFPRNSGAVVHGGFWSTVSTLLTSNERRSFFNTRQYRTGASDFATHAHRFEPQSIRYQPSDRPRVLNMLGFLATGIKGMIQKEGLPHQDFIIGYVDTFCNFAFGVLFPYVSL